MSEFFENKEYGDYFRRLESDLQSDPAPRREEPPTAGKPPRKRKRRLKKGVWAAMAGIVAVAVVLSLIFTRKPPEEDPAVEQPQFAEKKQKNVPKGPTYFTLPEADDETVQMGAEVISQNAVVLELSPTPRMVAQKGGDERVSPASTTKILTALIATEMIADYSATFTMTREITDAVYLAEATAAGFSVGEAVSYKDLLYGCILPSGGDGALGLAEALCGSEADFVDLMNERVREMGLKNTHFTNVVGLFDKNHYSSANDMAVILANAMKNDVVREILCTVDYTTDPTPEHPAGIPLQSTLFSYMYGNEPETATILAGKTGYVNEAGFCLATYGKGDSGREYIVVTFGGHGRWDTVFNLFSIYNSYAK